MNNAVSKPNETKAKFADTRDTPTYPLNRHSRGSGNPDYPRNWAPTNLGAVIELKYGKSLPARTRDDGEYPVFGSNGIVGGHSIPLVKSKGIIVGRKGSYGEVQFSEKPFYPIDTTYFVDDFSQQPPKYWFHQLKRLPLTTLNRSTAIPGLNREDAYAQPIFLPPLAEQKVIADKLDELLAQVDTLKARLDAIPTILKRFRQSVLAVATTGDLTHDFRNKVDLPEPRSSKIGDCIKKMTGGCSPKSSDYCKTGILTLNKGDIKPLGEVLIKETPKRLPELLKDRNKNKVISTGTLLLTLRDLSQKADFLGLISEYQYSEDALITQGMFSLELNTDFIVPRFLIHISNSPHYRSQVKQKKIGATQVHLRNNQFLEIEVMLPSLEEQVEIVRRVEQLFTYADQVEQQVKNAQARVNQLTQAILAKAFRGELTEQWRQDNPELISGDNSAAALLERIKAERAAAKPAKKTKGRKINA